jgi:hypothetical protein
VCTLSRFNCLPSLPRPFISSLSSNQRERIRSLSGDNYTNVMPVGRYLWVLIPFENLYSIFTFLDARCLMETPGFCVVGHVGAAIVTCDTYDLF